MRTSPILLFASALVASAPALAAEGVLELSHTCATATGCFAGDAAGYPVTISFSGAYRLTSDLVTPLVGGANTTLVQITANHVDLDLNGFALRGLVSCTGSPAECSATGSGRGVDASGNGVSIHDGLVYGMGSNGLFASLDARISNVIARSNGGNGIFAGTGSVMTDLVSSSNGGGGIVTGGSAVIRDSVARANGSQGFSLQTGSFATGIVANSNGGDGILAANSTEITGCTAVGNEGDGVQIGAGSTVRDCTTRVNDGAGINATGGDNLVVGIQSSSNGRYSLEGNMFFDQVLLGCSTGAFPAVDPSSSPLPNGASAILACAGP